MDLRGLGAFLSAIGSLFSAKAGATAGQLQGLLMGEELTERRKRMKMAEEAHQLQMELARAQEARTAELFPIQRDILRQQYEQQGALFPLKQEALATQVEMGKLNLEDTRLWTLFRQGVVPSQISDPVLRARYEPFFNFQMATRNLEAVQTREDLDAILQQVPEELRPSLEIMGRMHLFTNQTRQQMIERQMRGLDLNIAQGEFQLRTLKLNTALTAILNNINNEGMDWDKRSPQQKIEAVKKWIKQLGLEDVVPEDFANMFQRVKSADARQFALYRAQAELQHRYSMEAMSRQFGYNRALQQEAWWGNIVAGALAGGAGQGVAPVGFFAPPQPPAIFRNAPDQNGSYINQSVLNTYVKPPVDIPVPYGNGGIMLSALGAKAYAIYNKLGRPNADLTVNDINDLITYHAGLYFASAQKDGFPLDWNTALTMGADSILPILEGNHLYQSNPKYQAVLNKWKRAWYEELQRRQQGQGVAPQQTQRQTQQGQRRQGGQGGQRTAPITQADIPRGRIGREP